MKNFFFQKKYLFFRIVFLRSRRILTWQLRRKKCNKRPKNFGSLSQKDRKTYSFIEKLLFETILWSHGMAFWQPGRSTFDNSRHRSMYECNYHLTIKKNFSSIQKVHMDKQYAELRYFQKKLKDIRARSDFKKNKMCSKIFFSLKFFLLTWRLQFWQPHPKCFDTEQITNTKRFRLNSKIKNINFQRDFLSSKIPRDMKVTVFTTPPRKLKRSRGCFAHGPKVTKKHFRNKKIFLEFSI